MLITYTGRNFDYQNITKDSIHVEDIVRSLPRLNRFVGHSSVAYSVGEHSVLCAKMATKLGFNDREILLTFIHDFTEAYVGDCPAPLKALLPEFSKIEGMIEQAIYESIGIEPPTLEERIKIKRVDITMLAIEMRDFTLHNYTQYCTGDSIYEEMLHDEEFNLKNMSKLEDRKCSKLLIKIFNDLIFRVKG